MTNAPPERWEFSLLVDGASKIQEARGMSELYLGARAGQLIGRPLVSFIDEGERLGFLRYLARLLVRGEVETVAATLRTPAVGIKRFSMAAKRGDGKRNWWILFSQDPKTATPGTSLDASDQPYASEEEFAALTGAHDHVKLPLDITVFRARALSEGAASSLSAEQRQALDDELGETLMSHAHESIVARPAAGEYALLHRPDKSAAEIERSLVAVAAQHNVAAEDLEIVRETRRLAPDGATLALMREMRGKLQARAAAEVVVAPPRRRRWVSVAIAGGAIALLLILVWIRR
ncbi:MAG TPA: PAS domain-containing protein [Candidatus Cybelea sp.]|nr:PAS domain-containing protein [Candidatus Cybelea sp.]